MANLAKEFREFALKGHVIDLAVAVVIGAAFTKLVTSVVENLLMPLLSYVTPSQNYREWTLGKLTVGAFLGDFVSFLILTFAVFILIVKVVGWLTKRGKEPPAPAPLSRQEQLLTEIRDQLRTKQGM